MLLNMYTHSSHEVLQLRRNSTSKGFKTTHYPLTASGFSRHLCARGWLDSVLETQAPISIRAVAARTLKVGIMLRLQKLHPAEVAEAGLAYAVYILASSLN